MVEGHYPKDVKEALALRREFKNSIIICGGSDAMVVKKSAEHVIFINEVKELQNTKIEDGNLHIGAGAVYSQLLSDENLPQVLRRAIRTIASPAVRNAGTIGGNICNASPAGDTLPVLYALDAVIVKSSLSQSGEMIQQRQPIEDFIRGVRKIDLAENEMVTSIEIPVRAYEDVSKTVYEKVGARQADAISKLSFLGLMKWEDTIIRDVRICFGSVSVTAVRRRELEEKIIGLSIEELRNRKPVIISEYAEFIRPIDDQRSTAAYRKKVCLNLLDDFLTI